MEPPAGGLRCGLKFAYREAQRQTLWELFLWDWSLVIPIPTAYSRINTTNEPNSTTQRRIETGQSQTIYATWVLQPITLRLNRQISSLDCTFDWQLLFTWLPWLPLRLSKRQSPLPTTVFSGLHSLTIQWVPRRVQTIYYSIVIINIIVTILICINFCILFEFGITSNSPDCYFLLIERILNLKSRFVFL